MFIAIAGCQAPQIGQITDRSFNFVQPVKNAIASVSKTLTEDDAVDAENSISKAMSIETILENSEASVASNSGFAEAIMLAVSSDPRIAAARADLSAKESAIKIVESQKDFQVYGSLYGGVEDVSDKSAGVALVLSASRLVYDGGLVDAQIAAETYKLESARYALTAAMDNRALELASIWVDLERYETLNQMIESRLNVLDPLITQLEKVAAAGVGDVTQVAAAQRTVSTIRVTQTDMSERLEQARLNFKNAFGFLPESVSFDADYVSNQLPKKVTKEMVLNAPGLLAEYSAYKAAEAMIVSIKAKDNVNAGFETRISRPFGGSGYDSDESIGLVLRKTLFNDKKLGSEIAEAEALVESSVGRLRATHREGSRIVKTAMQTIKSMDKAISIAKQSAQVTADEIIYLRRQLVIGGSTLDSVLTAEARLYDSEAREINFLAERQKSQLTILGALGLLSSSIGL
jgi:outer membrane protein TolC